jgi:hypothetical protein
MLYRNSCSPPLQLCAKICSPISVVTSGPLKFFPQRRYHKDGAKIIRELLKEGSISENTYTCLVGADTGDKLLETNVFAFHFNSQEITFQSTAVKRFCEENSDLWEGNE